MKTLRFAYLSSHDPKNKRVWSGTHYSIYRSLQSLGEVEILGPYEPGARTLVSKILNQVSLKIFSKRISYRHSLFVSKGFARFFNNRLRNGNFDYIVAPAASCELAFINTNVPVIYITDGTFAGCLNYHKSLTNLTKNSIREGNIVEQSAIDKSAYTLVSSEWAAQSVLNDYHCPSEKLFVFPYGANFEKLPAANEIEPVTPSTWKLLFVGVNWEEKGGEFAFNCLKILRHQGHPVTLTVLGCEPPPEFVHPDMKVIPFIDKNNTEGQQKLFEIYKEHHILLLPTRFDCTPIVINEASAFGMPCIVARTGGVQGHLKSGKNGFLVDYTDTGKAYAEKVAELINDPVKYSALRKSSRELYEEQLNWTAWTKSFSKMLKLS